VHLGRGGLKRPHACRPARPRSPLSVTTAVVHGVAPSVTVLWRKHRGDAGAPSASRPGPATPAQAGYPSALAMLQREMDALNAKLAAEKAAHLATEEARKTAMAELAAQPATAVASSPLAAAALAAASLAAATEPAAKSAASAASPRTKQGEARTRLEQLLLKSKIQVLLAARVL
jgi:hypothetical protein